MIVIGNVRNEVERIRSILLVDMELITSDDDDGYTLSHKVHLFLSSVDRVHIEAGSIFAVTHCFLFKFYGLIATYIAVLLSTSTL